MRVLACAGSLLAHVEEAEARKSVVYEKLLLRELAFDLAELDGTHSAAVGGQFACGVLLEADKQILRGGGGEGGKELFFKDGQSSLECFQILRCVSLRGGCDELGGELAKAVCGGGAGFRGDC